MLATLRGTLLFFVTSVLASHTAAQATEEAEAEELDAALDVFESSRDDGGGADERTTANGDAAADEDEDSSLLLDLRWTTFYTATGGEPETNLQLDEVGWSTEALLRPRSAKHYPSMWVALGIEWAVADWLLLQTLLDTREVRDGDSLEPPVPGITLGGNPADEEIREGRYIRELSAILGEDTVTVEVGRFRSQVADGLVYQDFGGGIRVRADLEALDVAPAFVELLITSVGQAVKDFENNPLLALRFDWNLSPFEYVAFFVAVTRDKNGEISEVLRSAYAENLLDDQLALTSLFLQAQGRGGHGYLGAMTQLIPGEGVSLSVRAALSGGKLELEVPLETIEEPQDLLEGRTLAVEVGGLALDMELHYGIGERWDLAGYALLLSGDEPPSDDGERYRSFIGLAPYWVWTGLFFSGGLNQGLYPNRSAAAGINGRGAVGIGCGLEYRTDELRAETRLFLLGATADPPPPPLGGDSRLYGLEWDLETEYELAPWLSVGGELDLLLPGGFFVDRDLAYQALALVTVSNGD